MFILETVSTTTTYTCGDLGINVSGQIINLVHLLYLGIQIVVPILLVIFGMLDLGKAVIAQKEDEIKKGQQMFVKRLITALIVFLVFSIVSAVVSFVSTDKNVTSCGRCFITGEVSDSSCKAVK